MANLYNGLGDTIEINSNGISAVNSGEFGLYVNDPTPDNNTNNILRNGNKYPVSACWGNEYLNGWYKKLFMGQSVTICVDGDSTTEEGAVYMLPARRAQVIGKLMRLGGCTNCTVHKNGYGSRASGDYTGYYYSSELLQNNVGTIPTRQSHPNGLLADTIAQDPDLIIFGYGLNDYNRYREGQAGALWDPSENLDLQGRLDLFKTNLEEFLQRLRGPVGTTVNGRECYGRDEYKTAVIICVPIARPNGDQKMWSYYCRKMIQEICRTYHCGFFDPTLVQYDHEWSNQWSRSSTGGASDGITVAGDGTHPAPYTNADFVSAMQPLLYPMGLWYEKDEKQYTVTYNLTNCSLTYEPDYLREKVKFETRVIANDGYTIDSVTMTQDGVEAGTYTTGTGQIQMGDVSGDIVITATASSS